MKGLSVAVAALLAGSAVAAPGTAFRRERQSKRGAHIRKTKPVVYVDAPVSHNYSNVAYSTNWAGAVINTQDVTSVTGTFTVPTLESDGSGSAWVGIDGDTCSTAILQTGVDWTQDGGSTTYDAWYEWYPDVSYDFSDIDIEAGDSITVTVTADSDTSGTAVITNNSQGQTVTKTFNGNVQGDLCMYDAEWIVEDFTDGSTGDLVAFADFGSISFTGASATVGGESIGVSDANILDIQQSSNILTDCSTSGSDEVDCSYV